MLVIVGHGPSVRNSQLGGVIDSHDVMRLKGGLKADPMSWGSRTDFLFSLSDDDNPGNGVRFVGWRNTPEWLIFWRKYSTKKKPSTGTCAIFAAVRELGYREIGLIGFDCVMNPNKRHPDYTFIHDSCAEHKAIHDLGVRIIDLTKDANGPLR